jgi:hypothetical protein
MLTVMVVLTLAALVTCVASAMRKCPIWVPVMILCLVALLQVLPLD